MTRAGSVDASPYLIEVTGVAGAGKSTLTRSISKGDLHFHLADFIHSRTPAHLPYIAHSIPRLSPILVSNLSHKPRLSWRSFKLLVYVTEWHRFLNVKPEYRCGYTLLDQGPIYALVRLKAEAGGVSATASFHIWWEEMIRVWAGQLRAIIWLDASDGVVWHRINERAQEHKTKGKPREVGHQFVNRYRNLFEETLSYVERLGRTEIMRFDTSERSSEELAAEVRARLNAGAARQQSRPSKG